MSKLSDIMKYVKNFTRKDEVTVIKITDLEKQNIDLREKIFTLMKKMGKDD